MDEEQRPERVYPTGLFGKLGGQAKALNAAAAGPLRPLHLPPAEDLQAKRRSRA